MNDPLSPNCSGARHVSNLRNVPWLCGLTVFALGFLLAVGVFCAVPDGMIALELRAQDSGRILLLGFGVLIALLIVTGVVSARRLHSIAADVEMRSLWPDGSVHWAISKGLGYYDEMGQPVRMEGMALDITARKRAKSFFPVELRRGGLVLALEDLAHRAELLAKIRPQPKTPLI